jgi:subfamily B ATP-binding cassette protein MsbA
MLFRPIRMLADRFNTLQMGMVGSARVFELLDSKEYISQNSNLNPKIFNGGISFKDVYFSYDENKPIFNGLTFDVKAGQTVAIVGPTGAGKTSLINLISRYYEFQKGSIKIDDFDIRNIDLDILRSKIGVVLQDVFLFNTTILKNITIGDLNISREDVIKAAKKVGVHEFINQLPKGYDFEVKERGGLLSSGQRQIIAFLRAYVYHPQILILDEATSSIDSLSEEFIQNATQEITKSRTSIIIAHRLSTIQNADSILVMDKGKIVEQGKHIDLLKNKGQYYELYKNQFISEQSEVV